MTLVSLSLSLIKGFPMQLFIDMQDLNDCIPFWEPFVLQCLSSGLPGGAAEELCGDAGTDVGREGLPGDWLSAPEGIAELP